MKRKLIVLVLIGCFVAVGALSAAEVPQYLLDAPITINQGADSLGSLSSRYVDAPLKSGTFRQVTIRKEVVTVRVDGAGYSYYITMAFVANLNRLDITEIIEIDGCGINIFSQEQDLSEILNRIEFLFER